MRNSVKKSLLIAVSIGLITQPILLYPMHAGAENRAQSVVDEAVNDGQIQKKNLKEVLTLLDQQLASKQTALEKAIKLGSQLKQADMAIDALTFGSALISVAVTRSGLADTYHATKFSRVSGITTGGLVAGVLLAENVVANLIQLARAGQMISSAKEAADMADQAITKIDSLDLREVPAPLRKELIDLRVSMVAVKRNPANMSVVAYAFHALADAAVVTGMALIAIGWKGSNGTGTLTSSYMFGVAAVGVATPLRWVSYLTKADQTEILNNVTESRLKIQTAIRSL
jgi:hypothetical protein